MRLAHPLIRRGSPGQSRPHRLRRLRGTVASRLDPPTIPGWHVAAWGTASRVGRVLDGRGNVAGRRSSTLARRRRTGNEIRQAARSAGGGWRASLACAEAFTMAGRLAKRSPSLDVNEISTEAVGPLSVGRAKSLYLQRRTEDRTRHWSYCRAREIRRRGPARLRSTRWPRSSRHAMATSARPLATADAGLRGDLPEFSTMLAQTAKTIAMGELGQLDDTGTGGYAGACTRRWFGRDVISPVRSSRRRTVLGVPDARATGGGRCGGRRNPGR